MKQGLGLGFSQSLAFTPQLQQTIRLLQLSSLELEQEVEQQLLTNPFLERDDGVSEREQFDFASSAGHQSRDDERHEDEGGDSEGGGVPSDSGHGGEEFGEEAVNWEGDGSVEIVPGDAEWGNDAQGEWSASPHSKGLASGGEAFDPLGGLAQATRLQDHLKQQARHLRLTQVEAASLDFLIDSLDERGFLTDSLDELASSLSQNQKGQEGQEDEEEQGGEEDQERLVDQFRLAQKWLQSLDPCGVGASSVSECLQLQLKDKQEQLAPQVFQVAVQLAALPLEQLAKPNVKKLIQTCRCPEGLIQKGLQAIRACEPIPARRFAAWHDEIVVPDVLVRPLQPARGVQGMQGAQGVRFAVSLNLDLMPRLKVDEITTRLLHIDRARAGKNEAMQQALGEARGFIKAITQRFDTVLRVAKAIVARQGAFLQHGAVAMRPLVLRDIADELGLHESTVSRVTTNKYMATPQGMFEFKYFFDASLGAGSHGATSGTAVRALLAQLIASESKAKPLSDGKLSEALGQQGIECARRTVTKYREAMRIPTASLRKLAPAR